MQHDKRTLVTGATGFLGRRLVRGLLDRGERVTAIVRAPDEHAARLRLLSAVGLEQDSPRLVAIAGDLSDLRTVCRVVGRAEYDEVFHLAALLDLGGRRSRALARANVDGTAVALAIARAARARRFHHVGTAYSCGRTAEPVPEERRPAPASFRNVYERTKRDAETLAVRAADARMSVTVYRPSIVVGESAGGATEVFGAFYDVVRLCALLGERGPITLPARAESHLDLVPVDGVVEALLDLSGDPATRGRAFHLTGPRPPTMADVAAATADVLGLRFTAILDRPQEDLPADVAGSFRGARAVLPYLREGPRFERRNTSAFLGEGALAPAETTARWVRDLVTFAAARRFGRSAAQWDRESRLLERGLRRSGAPSAEEMTCSHR